ncbi:uncharacterized protein LOC123538381 isoform X2 [Mercenaria mercenaria]|uniref:uncharacterized protein LOC123538381 isoform X2 n=1 Tax=Mercenaria mercenaria TaxID=6596 RepID=UPI00234E5C92|nr:uncharacterized protein LOC123538381 isoform X2 [Mercenaria mercenaria]
MDFTRGDWKMSTHVKFPSIRKVPLFDEQQVRHYLQMRRENMFSYTLRELVLPPVRDAKSFHVTRDDRLMERAGVGARSARGLPWCENEKESFQHHAEYLKRLSKLREELIQQEQSNLANALDRLRMRSYGREYVYSQPQKEKKARQRHSAQSDVPVKRNSLITTFEKFQRMRPKKPPPLIMPLEGKSLIEAPVTERQERYERHERRHGNHSSRNETGTDRSVEENVRVNLQRLTTHPIPSIPRQGRNNHRDIVLESSSFRRGTNNDANNSSNAEERIAQMQKQKQKLMKLRHDAREAEKVKLMPQSFRIDTLSDEDRMNLEKLKDYYCIYYVPAPSTSPVGDNDLHVHLPKIGCNGSCNHSFVESESGGSSLRSSRSNGLNGKQIGFKVTTDFPIPPCACDCSCKMYVSGNKVEAPIDAMDYSIHQTHAVNNPHGKGNAHYKPNAGYSRETSRSTDKSWSFAKSSEKTEKHRSPPNSQEKKRIRVDMPAIVYNTVHSPEPGPVDYQAGLVKAFKQKELRQKELSNLMEDVRELNKMTDTMSGTTT